MRLILCGGGWAEKTVIPNKLFESLIDDKRPILYIPIARNPVDDGYDSCKTWLSGELGKIKHGPIDMVNSADEIFGRNMNDYAAVFIGGGNTYKLLKELKDTGVFNVLQKYVDKGGLVYGCSAGALIFGSDIDSCLYMDPNDVKLEDTAGFNCMFGASFAAHYTNKNETKTETATNYLTQYSCNEPVIALPEEDSLYINGDMVQVIGTRPWYIFNNGVRREFMPNKKYTVTDFTEQINRVK